MEEYKQEFSKETQQFQQQKMPSAISFNKRPQSGRSTHLGSEGGRTDDQDLAVDVTAQNDEQQNFMEGDEGGIEEHYMRSKQSQEQQKIDFHQVNINEDSEEEVREYNVNQHAPLQVQSQIGLVQVDSKKQLHDWASSDFQAALKYQGTSLSSDGQPIIQDRYVGQGLMPNQSQNQGSTSTSNQFISIEQQQRSTDSKGETNPDHQHSHYFSLSNNIPGNQSSQQTMKQNSMATDQLAAYQNVFLNQNLEVRKISHQEPPYIETSQENQGTNQLAHNTSRSEIRDDSSRQGIDSEDLYVHTYSQSQERFGRYAMPGGFNQNLDIVEELQIESAQDSREQSRIMQNSSAMAYREQMDLVISDMNLQQQLMHEEAQRLGSIPSTNRGRLKNDYVNSMEDLRQSSSSAANDKYPTGQLDFHGGQQTGHFNSQEHQQFLESEESMRHTIPQAEIQSMLGIRASQARPPLRSSQQKSSLKDQLQVLSSSKSSLPPSMNQQMVSAIASQHMVNPRSANRNSKARTNTQRPPVKSSTIDVHHNAEQFTRKSESSDHAHSQKAKNMKPNYMQVRSKSQESRTSQQRHSSGGSSQGILKKPKIYASKQTFRDFTGKRRSSIASLPSSINSNYNSSKQNCTELALKYRQLFDKVTKLFPGFQSEALGSFFIPDSLQPSDGLPAISVFKQLNFMYDKCKTYRLEEIMRQRNVAPEGRSASCDRVYGRDHELDHLMNSQAKAAGAMLKRQIDNLQRENDYFQKQISAFKFQLQESAQREQNLETENQKRQAILNGQVQAYQDQILALQSKVEEMFQSNQALTEDAAKQRGPVSFRAGAQQDVQIQAKQDNSSFDRVRSPYQRDQSTFERTSRSPHDRLVNQIQSPISPPMRQNSRNANDLSLEHSQQIGYAQTSLYNPNSFEEQRQLYQLNNDVKDLRSKLKLQEEIVGHEKEQNKTLQLKIERLSQTFDSERKQFDLQVGNLKAIIDNKDEIVKQLTHQVDHFQQVANVEFPVMLKKIDTSPIIPSEPVKQEAMKSSTSAPKFVSMTKRTAQKPTAAQQAEEEMDMLLNGNFGGVFAEEFDEFLEEETRQLKNSQMPLRGRSTTSTNRAQQKKGKKPISSQKQVQHAAQIQKIFNLPALMQSQISSVIIADQALLEKKEAQKEKLDRLDLQLEIFKQVEKKVENLSEEKSELQQQLVKLSKENEDLKIKFSQLLDQFQEYVNETEKKVEEEQMLQKEEQEKLFQELNSTIKELEEMSQNLQKDCEDKFNQIQALQDEKADLKAELDQVRTEQENQELHVEELQKVKVQSLTEEIEYLKKHYMIEMDIIRNENKNLRQQVRSPDGRVSKRGGESLQKQIADQDLQGQQSPYQMRPTEARASDRQMDEQRYGEGTTYSFQNQNSEFKKYGGNPPENRSYRIGQNNDESKGFQNQSNFERGSPIQMDKQLRDDGHVYMNIQNQADRSRTEGQFRPPLHMPREGSQYNRYGDQDSASQDRLARSYQDHHTSALRSKSNERNNFYANTQQPEKRSLSRGTEERNQGSRIINYNNTQQDQQQERLEPEPARYYNPHSRQRSSSYERLGYYDDGYRQGEEDEGVGVRRKAKNIISGAQDTFDAMKKELVDKDKQIEQKNVEIVRLRMENEELKTSDIHLVSQQQRNQVLYELDQIAETLKIELDRAKLNLFKEDAGRLGEMPLLKNATKQSYQVITCEDKLISMLQEKLKGMRSLITLASEIFLLSNQHKYTKFNQEIHSQIKSAIGKPKDDKLLDSLKQDNALLQRTVYKYETTLAQLDSIFRREDTKDDVIFELKKLTEEQLHDIVKLQEDLDSLRRRLSEVENVNITQQSTKPDETSLRQENNVLKQEISMLREQAARNQFLQDGNDELINERRNLQLKLDQQMANFEDARAHVDEMKAQMQEKEDKISEIRTKITVIAELFEKKPIRQVYGFDVLCDFIHDKAKRLFDKYDAALREKKQLKEDRHSRQSKKQHQVQKELENAENQLSNIKQVFIPRLATILQRPLTTRDAEQLSSSFLREMLDDVEYQFNKLKHDAQVNSSSLVQSMDRIQELQVLLDKLSNFRLPSNANNFTNQNTAMNTFGQGTLGGQNSSTEQLHFKSTEVQRLEVDQHVKEKAAMQSQLEDFSHQLKSLQTEHQNLVQENNHLKYKISQVKSNHYPDARVDSEAELPLSNHAQMKETLRKDGLKNLRSGGSSTNVRVSQASDHLSYIDTYQQDRLDLGQNQQTYENYEGSHNQIYGGMMSEKQGHSKTMHALPHSNLTTMGGMMSQNILNELEGSSKDQ